MAHEVGLLRVTLFVVVCFSGTEAQYGTNATFDYCQNDTIQRGILTILKDAFISGMERRMANPVKLALSINGIPKTSIPSVNMSWFIADPVNFPNATKFPAEAHPGVRVDPLITIAPGRGHPDGDDLYTLKSAITFDDPNIVNNYAIDFEVHAVNLCFDVKFTLHNVGRLSMPDLGGFGMVPSAPHMHKLSNRVYRSLPYLEQEFYMTLEYPMEPGQAGNRAELRKASSRQFCRKSALDPVQASPVSRVKEPSYSLTDEKYTVTDKCSMTIPQVNFMGLFENHLLLFDKGKGLKRFRITMTTTTEVTSTPERLSPTISLRLGNQEKTNIGAYEYDKAAKGGNRSYEILVTGHPAPTVILYTPRPGAGALTLSMTTNGLSYHSGFYVLFNVDARDSGLYYIKAVNTAGNSGLVFGVEVEEK